MCVSAFKCTCVYVNVHMCMKCTYVYINVYKCIYMCVYSHTYMIPHIYNPSNRQENWEFETSLAT